MQIYIPLQGSLVTLEVTEEQLGNTIAMNAFALSAPVVEVLATCLMIEEKKLNKPELLFGLPFSEVVEKLQATATALYVQQKQIDDEMSRKRYGTHHFKASLFQLGVIKPEELLA